MTEPTSLTRRAVLTAGTAGAVGATTLALAACTSPGGSGAARIKTPTPIASGTEIVKLADIPVGGTRGAKIGDAPVLLAQPTAGTVVCFSAICTHKGCVVGAAAKEFDCPCHGSRFSAETGAVLNGPALAPLNPIAVTVSGDAVVTA